jgi:hypothetical protein
VQARAAALAQGLQKREVLACLCNNMDKALLGALEGVYAAYL